MLIYVLFVFSIIALLCYWLFPEIKGYTLEQVDELFGDQIVPRTMRDSDAGKAAKQEKTNIVEKYRV